MPIHHRRKYSLRLVPPDLEPVPIATGIGSWKKDFEADLRRGAIAVEQWLVGSSDVRPIPPEATIGRKRYRLRYVWDREKPIIGVVSCNPSYADDQRLDDTLANTTKQADLWGFGGVDQCNLSPDYGTVISRMERPPLFDDPGNIAAINGMLQNVRQVWLAWGAKPQGFNGDRLRDWNAAEDRVIEMVERSNAVPVVRNLNLPSGPKRALLNGYRAPGHPRSRNAMILTERPLPVEIVSAGSVDEID